MQIVEQFDRLSAAEAIETVAAHIRLYWEPRMRLALIAAIDAGSCHDRIISGVVDQLRTRTQTRTEESAPRAH